MKWKHTIWEDKKDEAINIVSEDGNKALDLAAQHYGYIDYADMAQERNWDSDEDDGLNIITDAEPIDNVLMKYTLLLDDQTVGTIHQDTAPTVGETVTVALHDENGNQIQKTGAVSEVLEESEY
jgi:hypothetical protein